MGSGLARNEPACHRAAGTHHKRKLTHDDFGRAQDHFRGTHNDYRRSHHDGVMMFVSRVPATPAFRENTSGGGEQGDDAG